MPGSSRRESALISAEMSELTFAATRFMESFNLQHWTRIGAMNLPSDFVLVPRPSSSGSIFWRRGGFEDEDEGRAREHLAQERFLEKESTVSALLVDAPMPQGMLALEYFFHQWSFLFGAFYDIFN